MDIHLAAEALTVDQSGLYVTETPSGNVDVV